MAWVCAVCGKKSSVGNVITRRGLAKKKGGVGKKTTGITKRKFRPNLQRIRIILDGKAVRAKVCTGCIKKGKIVKPA